MKDSKTKKHLINFLVKPLVAIALILAGCFVLNFLLIPPARSSMIEVTMADAEKQKGTIDSIFVGSSRTYRGIDAPAISEGVNKNVFDIAYENANYYSSYYLTKKLLDENNIERVFLEVSTTNFTREDSTEDKCIYRCLSGQDRNDFSKGLEMNYINFMPLEFTNHLNNFANGRFAKNIKNKFTKEKKLGDYIKNYRNLYKGNGFVYADVGMNSAADLYLPNSYFTDGKLWTNDMLNETQKEYFDKILTMCEEKGVEVVLYNPPYPQSVLNKHKDQLKEFDDFIHTICEEENLEYLNFANIKEEHITLSNNYFYNANHCNGRGAAAFAPIIAEIYNQLQSGTFVYSNWFNA